MCEAKDSKASTAKFKNERKSTRDEMNLTPTERCGKLKTVNMKLGKLHDYMIFTSWIACHLGIEVENQLSGLFFFLIGMVGQGRKSNENTGKKVQYT